MTASTEGLTYPPTLGFAFAAGGKSQYCVTPTTRSPAPIAKSVSVSAGVSETILCGAAGVGLAVSRGPRAREHGGQDDTA